MILSRRPTFALLVLLAGSSFSGGRATAPGGSLYDVVLRGGRVIDPESSLNGVLLLAGPLVLVIASSMRVPWKALPEITASDNRSPAGRLQDGVLTIDLEAREGIWYPEEKDGPGLQVQAFAERGHTPQIPGPIIRAPEGTEIRLTLSNAIVGVPLVVHGLHARPGMVDDTIQVASGQRREVRFRTGKPGTYYYWATTTGKDLPNRYGSDSQLAGALIVDRRGAKADDRVFVIGWWENPAMRAKGGDPFEKGRNAIVINGRTWPYTERLTYTVGDSIRWRWINAAQGNHPMHMHGSYYTVESTGDGERDNTFSDEARQALRISRLGLKNRKRINAKNQDETHYLAPLDVIAGNSRTVSDLLLARYHGDWHENIDHIFEEFAF